MLAIDTNIIVRYLTGDDPEQAAAARQLIDGQDVFVAVTVMLESEWVLRSVYGVTSADVCQALRRFAGLPRVSLESPGRVAQALERTEAGMDFADALHLSSSDGCEVFITFDRKFVRAARAAGFTQVREL